MTQGDGEPATTLLPDLLESVYEHPSHAVKEEHDEHKPENNIPNTAPSDFHSLTPLVQRAYPDALHCQQS